MPPQDESGLDCCIPNCLTLARFARIARIAHNSHIWTNQTTDQMVHTTNLNLRAAGGRKMKDDQMVQVAIYARVSTGDQDCARQLRDLRAYAERAGYTVAAEFTERASGMKNDREERSKVMALTMGWTGKMTLLVSSILAAREPSHPSPLWWSRSCRHSYVGDE